MFRMNLRVKFVSRVVVFTNIGEGLETNLARKFLRIFGFLSQEGLDESDKQSFKFFGDQRSVFIFHWSGGCF